MSELLENTAILLESEVMNPIKNDLASKGIDNSGKASRSLRIETKENENRVILWGVDYLEILNRGRRPGKFPPVDEIKLWVDTKPVPISAFLVGRKIAREGTEIFKNKSKGIQLENKIINFRSILKKETPTYAKAIAVNRLRNFHKAALKK